MSDELNWPVNAPPETETLRDENLLGSYAPLSTLPGKKQRKTTFLQFRTWIASKIGTASIKDVVLNQNVIPANISEAYTNELDPDLSAWSQLGTVTVTDSGLRFKNNILYKVLNVVGGDLVYKDIPGSTFTINNPDFTIVAKRGNTNTPFLYINEGAGFANAIGQMDIDFNAQIVTDTTGTLKKVTWKDNDTVLLHCTTIAFTLTSVVRVALSQNDVGAGVYAYWGLVQAADSTEILPFIDGSKTADVIDKPQIISGMILIDLEFEPTFVYNTLTDDRSMFIYYEDANHYIFLFYQESNGTFNVAYKSGGTERLLTSQEFDDGQLHTNINQRIRFSLFLNPISGGINDSMFICNPLEAGTINIDNAFSGTPDVLDVVFSLLSLAHFLSIKQAGVLFKSYRVFPWDGIKPTILNNNEMDTYLAGKTPVFSATSSPTVDRDSIDENTSTQNAVEKNASSIQLLESFDNPHYIGSINEPVFLNLWVNGAGSYSNAYYIKRSDGWVDIYGEIITGTVDQNAFEFDNGWKPFYKKDKTFPVESNGGFGAVTITADGFLKPITPSSNTSVILDGISFYAGF